MHRWTDPSETPEALRPCVLTLGNFDGVHRGHRAVLDALVEAGHRLGLPSVAVTFEPHPVAVLRPDEAPELIAPGADPRRAARRHRHRRPARARLHHRVRPADARRSSCASVFVRGLDARCVVVGMDTRFGYRNSGDVSTLADLGEHFGFEVVALDDVGDGERFSSSVVRRTCAPARSPRRPASSGGRTGSSAPSSTATTGAARSATRPRTSPPTRSGLVPLEGVYAGWLTRLDLGEDERDRTMPAAISVGTNPTFETRTGARSRRTSSTATTSTSTTSGSWSSSRRTSGRRCGSTASTSCSRRWPRTSRGAASSSRTSSRPDLISIRAGGRRLSRWARHDVGLYVAAAGTSVVGALLVWSATARTAARPTSCGTSSRRPSGWRLALLVSRVGQQRVRAWRRRGSTPGRCSCLVAVLTPLGSTVNGSRSWIPLPGGFTVQPSELAKVALCLALAMILAGAGRARLAPGHARGARWRPCSSPCRSALVLLQPDLGSAAVLVAMAFASSRWPARRAAGWLSPWWLGVGVVVVALTTPVLSDYQRDRLTAFADPSADPQGSGYQTRQVRIAIGPGGLWGQGLMRGRADPGRLHPYQQTDFVFSVAGEELGFVGATGLLLLLGVRRRPGARRGRAGAGRLRAARRRRGRDVARRPGRCRTSG